MAKQPRRANCKIKCAYANNHYLIGSACPVPPEHRQAFLDEHNISWCNWSVADKEETASALKPGASKTGNWPEDQITPSGKLVRSELLRKAKP
ncbi:hypothetical protein [Rufibacter sp. LB8]|uniref:hypothetical protein n=1 Tax=Rufibacter sp. LB8 TaxID=2777781 RepID=UPI00178C2C4E|nr:hypothetical protein [Rufibacter sp. LB8]